MSEMLMGLAGVLGK